VSPVFFKLNLVPFPSCVTYTVFFLTPEACSTWMNVIQTAIVTRQRVWCCIAHPFSLQRVVTLIARHRQRKLVRHAKADFLWRNQSRLDISCFTAVFLKTHWKYRHVYLFIFISIISQLQTVNCVNHLPTVIHTTNTQYGNVIPRVWMWHRNNMRNFSDEGLEFYVRYSKYFDLKWKRSHFGTV
jgi:hypothetical protein